MSTATYTRFELVRLFRNLRFFIFSLVFPLILFYVVAGGNRHAKIVGISFPTYYMVGMVAWGTMAAVVAGGARIAAERSVGWNRQLRLTPLSPRRYLVTKALSGYVMASVSIVLLYAAGMSLGVHLPLSSWLEMTGLVLVGLIPFAVFGILIGHLVSIDTMGPAMGGTISIFALLGGSWGPIGNGTWVESALKLLPSYWITRASQVAVHGGSWPVEAWVVVVVWTVVLVALTRRVYEHDTKRV